MSSLLRPWPVLGDDAYYGPARDFTNLLSPFSEADPAALLIQFLIVGGNVARRIPCLTGDETRHSTNLFGLQAGDTSKARKGSGFGKVLDFYRNVNPDWARHRIQSGLESGQGLIWAVRDPITQTVEKKDGSPHEITIDAGVDDKRLLVYQSEFSSVFKTMAREGSTLSETIRQAWDDGDLRSMVVRSPAVATGAHISIVGHITVNELIANFGVADALNGLANRFLFFLAKRSKILSRVDHPDIRDKWLAAKAQLRDLALTVQCNLEQVRKISPSDPIKFDDAAYQEWDDIYEELSADRDGLVGAMLARAEAQVSRLGFVYAVIDGKCKVEVDHLKAAQAVWRYCEQSVEYVFGENVGDDAADKILVALQTRSDGMSRTEISNLFGRHKSSAEIEGALTLLRNKGLAKAEAKGSHTPERWRIVSN